MTVAAPADAPTSQRAGSGGGPHDRLARALGEGPLDRDAGRDHGQRRGPGSPGPSVARGGPAPTPATSESAPGSNAVLHQRGDGVVRGERDPGDECLVRVRPRHQRPLERDGHAGGGHPDRRLFGPVVQACPAACSAHRPRPPCRGSWMGFVRPSCRPPVPPIGQRRTMPCSASHPRPPARARCPTAAGAARTGRPRPRWRRPPRPPRPPVPPDPHRRPFPPRTRTGPSTSAARARGRTARTTRRAPAGRCVRAGRCPAARPGRAAPRTDAVSIGMRATNS